MRSHIHRYAPCRGETASGSDCRPAPARAGAIAVRCRASIQMAATTIQRRCRCLARRRSLLALIALSIAGVTAAPVAQAQFAVIDVASVAQLMAQVRTLEQQLDTARGHLARAEEQFESMSGRRGMERLLSDTTRNYLPSDWEQVRGLLPAMDGSGGRGALAADVQRAIGAIAVLSAAQRAALTVRERERIDAARQSAALMQVLAHEALATTSNRFATLQQLIDAIPAAADQKAILDLQARIDAEHGMLLNEQTKLQLLYQSAQAEERANAQRMREEIIAGHGRFDQRFQPVP